MKVQSHLNCAVSHCTNKSNELKRTYCGLLRRRPKAQVWTILFFQATVQTGIPLAQTEIQQLRTRTFLELERNFVFSIAFTRKSVCLCTCELMLVFSAASFVSLHPFVLCTLFVFMQIISLWCPIRIARRSLKTSSICIFNRFPPYRLRFSKVTTFPTLLSSSMPFYRM